MQTGRLREDVNDQLSSQLARPHFSFLPMVIEIL
jgi:hypothetical protein